VKSSSHLKHLLSLRRWAISDSERRMELGVGLLPEVAAAVGAAVGVLAISWDALRMHGQR
jgi:hypothetical protein